MCGMEAELQMQVQNQSKNINEALTKQYTDVRQSRQESTDR